MANRKSPNAGNARFIELGSLGAPFRSLMNVDHITNIRYEQKIEETEVPVTEGKAAVFNDAGEMLSPPEQGETRMELSLVGWNIMIQLGETGQTIFFPEEEGAVNCYNTILDMIARTGNPISRMPKLKPMPKPIDSPIVGADGSPFIADDVPPFTEEELNQLENPEIDIDAIADAINDGLDKDDPVYPDDGRG